MRSRYWRISVTLLPMSLVLRVGRTSAHQSVFQAFQLRVQSGVNDSKFAFDDTATGRHVCRHNNFDVASSSQELLKRLNLRAYILRLSLIHLDGESLPRASTVQHFANDCDNRLRMQA